MSQLAPILSGGDRGPAGPVFGPRLSLAGGYRIAGIDLSRPLSSGLEERMLSAFRRHHVLVFRDQALTREQQYAFAASLGEVEGPGAGSGKRQRVAHILSNLDASGRPVDRSASPVSNYHWHTDKPYYQAPPMLTMLHAVELPPRGGDTEFANTALAYAALPEATKRRIDGLRVIFQWGASALGLGEGEVAGRETRPVDHPLVRTHPETGIKALYLGNHASHILGMNEGEGRALLDELLEQTTQPRFVYAHRWQRGDLVMWDNRCLLHRAVANYDTRQNRRILHRSVIRGSVPF